MGHEEKAKQYATEVLRIKPKISIELIGKRVVVKNDGVVKSPISFVVGFLQTLGIPYV